jgi:hypothetical protein
MSLPDKRLLISGIWRQESRSMGAKTYTPVSLSLHACKPRLTHEREGGIKTYQKFASRTSGGATFLRPQNSGFDATAASTE